MPVNPVNLAAHLKVSRCGVFYFRMRVPAALRPLVGKREILQSLRTRSPAIARKLAYDLTSKTYALFQKMAYDPQKFNPNDPSTFPFSDADRDALRRYELEFGAIKIKAEGEDDHLRAMGMLNEFCKLPPEVIAAVAKAAAPPPPPAPAQWVAPPPAHTISISNAMDAYLPTLTDTKTRNAAKRAIGKFIEHRGDGDIHTVKGVDVSKWNTSLLKTIKERSADNAIQSLQSLLKWAYKNEYIHEATKLATEGKFNVSRSKRAAVSVSAEPFSVEQLVQIFDPATYNGYCGEIASRYWMPLIALHTGMRVAEIAQLHTSDIRTEDGIDYIDINDRGGRRAGKSLKSECAERLIPIHDTLLRLGFMDYVRSRPRGKLFSNTGNAVSHAFIRYLVALKVKQAVEVEQEKKDNRRERDGMVFHSFRDTFNNRLRKQKDKDRKVDHGIRLTLMGHEQSDTNTVNYSTDWTLQELKEGGIDRLDFVETVAGVRHELVLTARGKGGAQNG